MIEDGISRGARRFVEPADQLRAAVGSDRMPPAPGGTEWVLPPSWLRPITGPGAERAIEQERVRDERREKEVME